MSSAVVEAALLALRSDDAGVRSDAARTLGQHGECADAGPALMSMVDDADDLVRAEAVDALGVLGYEAAVDAVRNRLRSDRSALVRAAAAETLGDLGGDAALPDLVGGLDDPDAAVRAFAASSLGLLGGAEILPALDTRLRIEGEPGVRVELQGARARLGAPGALAALRSTFDDMDEDLGVNMLNLWDDLVSRRCPPDLATEAPEIVAALARAATRFPLLRQQAHALVDRVSSCAPAAPAG